jgi:hypothetical protein
LVVTLALAVAACATHHKPPAPPPGPADAPFDPPTAYHCNELIQDIVVHMNAVDFNTDRKGELARSLKKARGEQAKGRFDKCVKYAKDAIYWAR